jgi:uncharacterized protein YggE
MMKTSKVLFAIGLMLLPLVSANAQWQYNQQPQINVSGSAEIKVVPDEVDLKVGVETRDENVLTAKDDNDQRVAAALDFLKSRGVKDKDVQTDFVTIEPVYDDNSGSINPRTGLPWNAKTGTTTKPIFYLVRKAIGIKLTDVADFDMVLAGLITNGVNTVQGVEFRTTELRKYKDQARAEAIKAAKEKADAMASALGVKVGKPLDISVNDWGGWTEWSQGNWGYSGGFGGGGGGGGFQNVSQNAGGNPGENGPTFAVGEISVSANVSVTFLIQ